MHADTEPEGPAEPVRELHARRVHQCTLRYFCLKIQPLARRQLCLHVVKQGVPPHGASVGAPPAPVNPQASPIHRPELHLDKLTHTGSDFIKEP